MIMMVVTALTLQQVVQMVLLMVVQQVVVAMNVQKAFALKELIGMVLAVTIVAIV